MPKDLVEEFVEEEQKKEVSGLCKAGDSNP